MEKVLERGALDTIDNWIRGNARPLEIAKWDSLDGTGSLSAITNELIRYQNPDGGFGNGLEPDLIMPFSTAIGSAEAVFTLLDYRLDGHAPWFGRLLDYFMDTVRDTPSFWEPIPPAADAYPRPPWWNYGPDVAFSPNPCAVVAAALLLFGNVGQRSLGERVAQRCLKALLDGTVMHDHDVYCMQRLVSALKAIGSPLFDDAVTDAMNLRVLGAVNTDPAQWGGYVAQPLDLVDSPESPWYPILERSIPMNIRYWIDDLGPDGVWNPNFSWGNDSAEALTAMRQWKGYMAVRRVRILRAFGAVAE